MSKQFRITSGDYGDHRGVAWDFDNGSYHAVMPTLFAEVVVQRCNAHDALVAALEAMLEANDTTQSYAPGLALLAERQARAALALAK